MSGTRADKKRANHACDQCRRRKIRCDSAVMPDNICSSCLSTGSECTHNATQQKRGPKPGSSRAILSQSVKDLVGEILKGTDSQSCLSLDDSETTRELIIKLVTRIKVLEVQLAECRRKHTRLSVPLLEESLPASELSSFDDDEPLQTEETDAAAVDQLSREMAKFTLAPSSLPRRVHFGEANNMLLMVTAMDHRKKVDSNLPEWKSTLKQMKRPEFWELPEWLPVPVPNVLHFEFPDDNELKILVNAYFTKLHVFFPLLHRPSFEKSLSEGLHLRDNGFGALVLAICAVACRHRYEQRSTDDPDTVFLSSGMKWFKQLPIQQFSFGQDVTLYHLQMYCLAMHYLQNVATGLDVGNMMTAIAVRLVQERGAHRHASLDVKDLKSKKEAELWKRVFWTLLMIDMKVSMVFGSPRGMSTQDFDIDLPIECDDEYWENDDPDRAFVQPPGKPALIACWNHYMKLVEITTFAQQALYSVRNSELWRRMGVSSRAWKQKAIVEIDADLTRWLESVPDHLHWDPNRQNEIFFAQSSILYSMYYWIQIQIHRRFIPRPGQAASSSPSLRICTNAARSCVHVVETCLKRVFITHNHFLLPLFSSAMILAVSLWRGMQINPGFNPREEFLGIYRCIDLLRLYESRYTLAGRLVDIINTVMAVSQWPPSLAEFDSLSSRSDCAHDPNMSSPTRTVLEQTADESQTGLKQFMIAQHLPYLQNYLNGQSFGAVHPTNIDTSASLPSTHGGKIQASDPPLSSQTPPTFGYQYSFTREELAVFDESSTIGTHITHWQPRNQTTAPLSRTSNSDTQDHDWDIFMTSVDQLLSTMESSEAISATCLQPLDLDVPVQSR